MLAKPGNNEVALDILLDAILYDTIIKHRHEQIR